MKHTVNVVIPLTAKCSMEEKTQSTLELDTGKYFEAWHKNNCLSWNDYLSFDSTYQYSPYAWCTWHTFSVVWSYVSYLTVSFCNKYCQDIITLVVFIFIFVFLKKKKKRKYFFKRAGCKLCLGVHFWNTWWYVTEHTHFTIENLNSNNNK